ncbi:MAP7 domain-containing protein 3 isoform X7 [Pyxicephalus adspersus]|uniref:MAP7 domain-containing protein 3 isoform X7 n=1 Tax=Pyxicephalus adspersus TaxID=30357 RepID=UPI003B5C9988
MRSPGRIERAAIPGEGKMADGSGKLKELREQMVAAAQALADERRSQAGSSPIPVHSTASGKTTKPVIDGPALRTDERQRLARERREEKERLNAAKEKELIEKEKKAKLQYEKQMEEKQKKLEEQKIKDEQKRTAAEGKRKQKLQEEKERREATLRRTLERSSQLDQRQKRWSWGGSGEGEKHTNKRSTSASNLKQADSVVNKRLSSSSATLQTSEKASATTISTPPSVSKGPMRSRSIDRMKSPQSAASGASSSESSQKPGHEKSSPPSIGKRPPSPNVTLNRRSPSPTSTPKRAPSPTLEKKASSSLTQKNRPPSPSLLKQRPPSPTVTHKPIPIQRPSLTPTVLNATKKISDSEAKPKEKPAEGSSTEPKNVQASEKEATTGKTKDESSNKTVSGSTTAEEAAKILAEKRRLAREQREREEKERIQRQQEEKIRQEEMARKAEEEKERLKEEAKLLEEKRKLESEAEERKALEEKLRRDLEEQERLAELQQQKEEAEARALEEAEKQRQEREKIMQQNMQERLERKKRIEEIMKRTRKGDQADAKNEERSEEDEENFSLDKNIHGEVNGTDISDADGPQEVILTPNSASSDFLSQNAVVEESNDLFMNGDEPDIDQQLNGHVLDTAPKEEFSQVISDTNNLNVDQTHLSEHITNTNGKPSSWTFEEIIDLEIHSKNSSLSESTDDCNTVLIEAATVPPKLAFEEGHVNSLSLAIETATEI